MSTLEAGQFQNRIRVSELRDSSSPNRDLQLTVFKILAEHSTIFVRGKVDFTTARTAVFGGFRFFRED